MAITNSFDKTYDATLIIVLAGFVAGLIFLVILNFNALKGAEKDLVEPHRILTNKIGYENVYNPVASPMENLNSSKRGSSVGWNTQNNTDSLQLVNSNDVGSNPFENTDFPYPEPSSNGIRKASVGTSGNNGAFGTLLNHQQTESYEESIQLKPYSLQAGPEIRVTGPSDNFGKLV